MTPVSSVFQRGNLLLYSNSLALPAPPPLPLLLPLTGEDVYTQLYGSANDINIRLDRSSITLKDTFIGLSSQRSGSVCVY